MKVLLAACASALLLATPAWGHPIPPDDQAALNEATSWIANRPVTVQCMDPSEPASPDSVGAWAFVFLDGDTIYADTIICDGALGITHGDDTVPFWKRAFGALVLTHEAFHLRLNMANRGNEAATECRAIRHARYMMRHLGATPKLAARLMTYALAAHWRIAAVIPLYYLEACKVPPLQKT